MKKEWYENTEWDNDISKNFEAKLSKASEFKKPQYLMAQASNLKGKRNDIAKSLLDRVKENYADDDLSYANAMSLMGDILFDEQEFIEAENYYRYVHYDLKTPFRMGMKNGFDESDIKLIKIILISKQVSKYSEAYTLVKAHDMDLDFFKYHKYDFAYHAAWLCKELGKIEEAKDYAKMALDFAIDKRADAPMHGNLGAFEPREEELKFLSDIVYKS